MLSPLKLIVWLHRDTVSHEGGFTPQDSLSPFLVFLQGDGFSSAGIPCDQLCRQPPGLSPTTDPLSNPA